MKPVHKPYSESCEQNRQPILAVIKPLLRSHRSVLEIGSGTGQHAVFFAAKLPHLTWYTSDQAEYLAGIELWQQEALLDNIIGPYELDVMNPAWPDLEIDAVFSANTCHIMSDMTVAAMFRGVGDLLKDSGSFLLYGPFNYNGHYTSRSNADFDQWLKARDPESGIKDFEVLDSLAQDHGLALVRDYAMPANNRILHWHKTR